MSNYKDFKNKNTEFTGTIGIDLPEGNTSTRVNTKGVLRFNTDLGLAEYYTGTEWKAIDAPPVVSSVSPASPVDDGSTVTEITVGGSAMGSGGTLQLVGNDQTVYTVSSFTFDSPSQIRFNYTSALAAAGTNGAYTIKYTNPSGLFGELTGGLTPNTGPVFNSPAEGTVLFNGNTGTAASSVTAINVTDASGGTLVYSIADGALPTGLSINSSTGAWTGTVNEQGTFNFRVEVTDGSTTVHRYFSISATVPRGDAEYTTAGSYTWTVPSGVTNVAVVCIGAGGTSGLGNSGQAGGGGGLAYRNSISVTPGSTGSVTVGGSNGRSGNNGQSGSSSSFTYGGTTTTAGGGGGGTGDGSASSGTAGGGGSPSGTYTGGGSGGSGGQDGQNAGGPGGGGAGGYSGNGGGGASGYAPTTAQAGSSGGGGGGGGGGKGGSNEAGGGGGGGVGFYGEGSSGGGGSGQGISGIGALGGGAGSGGTTGGNGENSSAEGGSPGGSGGQGGNYGGGQGGTQSNGANNSAGGGAVRIVWDPNGTTPAFPSTNVDDA